MTETTIRVPGNIQVNKISEEIIYKAFAIAVEQKKKEIHKELKQVNSRIKRWEKKYKMSFEKFEQTMGDGFQEHNDWMDWSFLIENRNQLLEEIRNFEIT
jgi:hypothetical protein